MTTTTTTAFRRHLSFFSHSRSPTGTITPLSSLRSALSLGFDFPVALAWSIAVPLLYGNSGLLRTSVTIAALSKDKERSMLEGFPVRQEKAYTRQEISAIADRVCEEHGAEWSYSRKWIEWLHVFNIWTFAADSRTGLVRGKDVELFQRGELLEELARRRRVRREDGGNVLPLLRGGPIWVGGHSWFVGALFGVRVYEREGKEGRVKE